ncbi:hypothetical protein MBLNU230_g1543t1 [Neophaeotheca triangularis]
MISWQTIQSILIFFGPVLLPRLLSTYRSLRAGPSAKPQTLPTHTSYALGILFISGSLAFLSTLPLFAPTNIFKDTQSRIQTQTSVLITRLKSIRTPTDHDDRLRTVLEAGGLDARLLYAQYGPDILADCPFANPGDMDAATTYLFYAVPSLLAPHLLHLFALGVATSGVLAGKEGARWRTAAIIAGLVLAAAELFVVGQYDHTHNARSTRLSEVDWIYWKLQVYRGLLIAGVDGLLGWVIWLQATGRAFLSPPQPAEVLLDHVKMLEGVAGKARGLGVVSNACRRDRGLRSKTEAYWVKEGEVMKDVMEEGEVVEAQRQALRRVDVGRVSRDAEQYVDAVLGNMHVAPAPSQAAKAVLADL